MERWTRSAYGDILYADGSLKSCDLPEAQTKLVLSVAEVKESGVTTQTIQIEVSGTLLERARVQALDEARELITFLLENYVQELEKAQRRQAYEAYYAARTPEDEAEELELLAEFAFADAEVTDETTP